jgi:hypothetical protein
MSTSPREGSANAGSSNGLEEKPRLSEHEKKANHIASGKKPSAPLPLILSGLAAANFAMQSRNVDKQSAKASTDLPNWSLDWKVKAEAKALS